VTRPLLARLLLLGVLCAGACKGDRAAADDAAAAVALSADETAALQRLAAIDLEVPGDGAAECAEYQVAAGPALADIDRRLAGLAADPADLGAGAAWLASQAEKLAALEPPGTELSRLHRELAALLADVADALGQAGAGAPVAARLDNAADNLDTTVAALKALCTAS
jgi:hypothetical protein